MQCLGLTGACAACSHCTATAWELSDLDHSHAAIPQRVTRASCAQLFLLRSDFCAWRRLLLLLICWKLLIGVCVRDGLAASVTVCAYILYRTFAAFSVELRPRGWRAVVYPRWLHDQSGSTWLIVILIVRCCFGGLCVTRRSCCLFAHVPCRTSGSAASVVVEPLALCLFSISCFYFFYFSMLVLLFFPWLQVLSCSTWLIVRCYINHQLLCFGFISATSNTSWPPRE